MYIAVTYIGSRYVPGEIISEDTPKERLNWLKRAGAIREAAPDPEAPVVAGAPEDSGRAVQAPAPESNEQEAEAPEDEIDEEAEAPEIDVMDGIVSSAEKSQPEEAAKKTTRKGRKKA